MTNNEEQPTEQLFNSHRKMNISCVIFHYFKHLYTVHGMKDSFQFIADELILFVPKDHLGMGGTMWRFLSLA